MAPWAWMPWVMRPPDAETLAWISGTELAGQAVMPAWAASSMLRSLWLSPMAKQLAAVSWWILATSVRLLPL